ncbi:hypothetical protein SAY87_012153 [Trapa incisa]|uniref:Uncharacterized protein n=1 Tax=Trapa incisa TaxID=236973 RepID=A0AAN7GH14_9MYRT|nr:hypothetical protein SAY87_012153 [Trapa incisa]
MRHTFESLGYRSGLYLSQLFSSDGNTSSSWIPTKSPAIPTRPPPAGLFNWGQRPFLDGKSQNDVGPVNPKEFLNPDSARKKMDGNFKRSFTLPDRMARSSSSASVDQHPMDYSRAPEPGIHSDMEPFMD